MTHTCGGYDSHSVPKCGGYNSHLMKGGDYDSQLVYEIIQYLSDYIY